jgi:Tol biopolymer transport system component
MPDGSAIVFASTREGGDFDLWRQPVANGRATGPAEQLTHAPGHEITPTVAADGAIIYAALTPMGGHEVESHLEQRAADGTITKLSAGPADTSPALSPDGKTLVFARPFEHDTKLDTELWRVARGGELATQLVDLPLTDESGPVWSRDGRFVFATSVLRTPEAGVVFSSVIYVDLQEPQPRARLLQDHAGALVRLTPAIAARTLDVAALHGNPDYLPELARILDDAIARAQQEAVPSKP